MSGTVRSHRNDYFKFTEADAAFNISPTLISRPGEYQFNFLFTQEHSFGAAEQLAFPVAPDVIPHEIKQATLHFSGGDCSIVGRQIARSAGRSFIVFPLSKQCGGWDIPAGTQASVHIKDSSPGHISLAARSVSTNTTSSKIFLRATPNASQEPKGFASLEIIPEIEIDERIGPDLTRANLLAFMWGPPFTGSGIILGVVGLLSLYLGGALALLKSRTPVGLSIATFCLCIGLFGCWSLLTPPLHAPDEPDHFLTFFDKAPESSGKYPDVLAWANRMHFERIKFRPEEGFNGAHTLVALSEPWSSDIAPVDMQTRSTLTFQVWQLLVAKLSTISLPAGAWLYLLRIVNSLAVAITFAIACFVISSKRNTTGPVYPFIAFLMPLLAIPTLAFFLMHVSNYGFSIAGYVVCCASLFLLKESGCRKTGGELSCGILLGLGMAISILSSRSAFPMFALLFFVLLTRSFFEKIPSRNTSSFWIAFGLSFLITLQLSDAVFQNHIISIMDGILEKLGILQGKSSFELVEGLIGIVLLILLSIESSIQKARTTFKNGGYTSNNTRTVYFVISLIFTVVAVAAIGSPGKLANNQIAHPLQGLQYVWPVLIRFVDELFVLSVPDFYLTASFWGGFGWLDRRLPPLMIYLLKMVPLGALFAYGFHAIRHQEKQQIFLKVAIFFVAAVFLVGVSAYAVVPINLHGRYLIFPYMLLMLPVMSLMQSALAVRFQLPGLLIGSLLLMHTVLWCWLLNKYFF